MRTLYNSVYLHYLCSIIGTIIIIFARGVSMYLYNHRKATRAKYTFVLVYLCGGLLAEFAI